MGRTGLGMGMGSGERGFGGMRGPHRLTTADARRRPRPVDVPIARTPQTPDSAAMRILWTALALALLAVALVDAKKKKKFDGDFEFADEVHAPSLLILDYIIIVGGSSARAHAPTCHI